LAPALTLVAAFAPLLARASEEDVLDRPGGSPLLVIAGSIDRTTDGVVALFDRAMLEGLATEAPGHVGGRPSVVPVVALIAYVGGSGTRIEARSLDDRRVSLPMPGRADALVLLLAPTSDDEASTVALVKGRFDSTGTFQGDALLDRVVRLRIE
jgi:hypothetical protein